MVQLFCYILSSSTLVLDGSDQQANVCCPKNAPNKQLQNSVLKIDNIKLLV